MHLACAGACRGQKRSSNPLKLESQAICELPDVVALNC